MNLKSLTQQLQKEGFKHIYEWRDKSHTEYPPHQHKDKVSFYIIDGSLNFYLDGKTIELKEGDRFDVPPKKEHTAKVGPRGCYFLVGEVIEGDS